MEAVASDAGLVRDAVVLHVLQAVVQMVRQVKRLVDHLEQKEVTGKVEYRGIIFLCFFFYKGAFFAYSSCRVKI